MAKAQGIKAELLVVADDVAVDGGLVGRRGLACTVLVHKIAGAMAEKGMSLDAIAKTCREFIAASATIGVGLGKSNLQQIIAKCLACKLTIWSQES
jgi:dihydroxyacetone kinase